MECNTLFHHENTQKKKKKQEIVSKHQSDLEFKDFMNFFKICSKKLFLFLGNNTTLLSDFGRTYYKVTASKNVKAKDNKIKKKKA